MTLDWAMRLVCLIVVPASVALFALAGPLTVVIFNYGAFVETDVYMTTYALMACLIGLGIIGSIWSNEPAVKTAKVQTLREAFIQPSVEYFSRKGALEVVGASAPAIRL